jgi:hypothetical protein
VEFTLTNIILDKSKDDTTQTNMPCDKKETSTV